MSPRAKTAIQTWLNPAVTVLTGAGVIWVVTTSFGSMVYSNVKELHENTRDLKAFHLEYSTDKVNRQVSEDKQDSRIQENAIDIVRLSGKIK